MRRIWWYIYVCRWCNDGGFVLRLSDAAPRAFNHRHKWYGLLWRIWENKWKVMEFWQRGPISHWHRGLAHLMFNSLTFKGHYTLPSSPLRHTDMRTCAGPLRRTVGFKLMVCLLALVCQQECEFCRRGGPQEDEGVRGPDGRSALRHPDRLGEQRDWQQGTAAAAARVATKHSRTQAHAQHYLRKHTRMQW